MVLSDHFSNGYGYGVPDAEKIQGAARSRSEWTGARMMGAEALWQAGFTGRGIKVAVVDTGVDAQHPFLNGSVTGGYTPFGNGTSQADYDDVHGHGSHVAGIIKQVAPDAQLLAVRVFNGDNGGTTPEVIEQGVRWAIDNGAKVINLSLGGATAPPSWEKVFRDGADKGVLFAVASGNDRGFTPLYPAAYAATIKGFGFSVGALDALKNLAVFSNWTGNSPSMMQVSSHGVKVKSVNFQTDGFVAETGTSMAAPQLAGYLALLRQAYPNASNVDLIARVTQNVQRAAIND
jgi:subtilisin